MSDPYDLLRRAKAMLDNPDHNNDKFVRCGVLLVEQWLADFKKLPGAKLSKKEVRVLQDPRKRMRDINKDIVVKLAEGDYLQKVRQMRSHGSGAFVQLRISKKGHEALRLRSDVDED